MRKESLRTKYHAIIAACIMLAGWIIIAGGIILKFRDPLRNILFWYRRVSGSVWVINNLPVFAIVIIIGGLCILLSILAIVVSKASSYRALVLLIYVLLLCTIISALVFVAVFLLSLSTDSSLFNIDQKLQSAWEQTVLNATSEACDLQEQFQCFGFRNDFCVGCGRLTSDGERVCNDEQKKQCPICDATPAGNSRGCYAEILNRTRKFWRPIGISSATLASLLFLDIVVVCISV